MSDTIDSEMKDLLEILRLTENYHHDTSRMLMDRLKKINEATHAMKIRLQKIRQTTDDLEKASCAT